MSILENRVLRREEPKFLTVGGTYVDDVRDERLTGAAYVTFVRSTMAHARITSIDTTEAAQAPGVVGLFTAEDTGLAATPGLFLLNQAVTRSPLASGKVRFVGESVVAIVTEQRDQGEDAAEPVWIDYDPLPAVVDMAAAVRDEVVLHDEAGTNVVMELGDPLDEGLFEGCEVVVSEQILNQRVAVVTNTTPTVAYRGAGRPEASAAIERALDLALETSGYEALRAEQPRRRDAGDPVQLGIGVAVYVEVTGGPYAGNEVAKVEITPDGGAIVYTGTSRHGLVDAGQRAARRLRRALGVGRAGRAGPQARRRPPRGQSRRPHARQARRPVPRGRHAERRQDVGRARAGIGRAAARRHHVPGGQLHLPVRHPAPTTANPLGAKGIREWGTIGATPAVQSAVVDALSHLGIRHIDMPATPQRVWSAIQEAALLRSAQ